MLCGVGNSGVQPVLCFSVLQPSSYTLHPISCTLHPLGDWGLGGASRFGVHSRRGLHHGEVHAVPGLQHDGDPRFRGAPWGGAVPRAERTPRRGALGTGGGDLCPGAAPGSFPHQLRGRTGPGGGRGSGRDRGAFGEAGGP